MKRFEAIQTLRRILPSDSCVVSCNGMISRELYHAGDRRFHFYMLGSMGAAASIGLGLALARPDRRVVVLDGDGNLLMGLGALATIAAAAPPRFLHVVLDNSCHASTGGQPTVSNRVPLERIAAAAGYRWARRAEDPAALETETARLFREPGPGLLLIRVEPGNISGLGRVEIEPPEMARRFQAAVFEGCPGS